ncbi:DNA-3-methyladenine glycosylase [Pararhodonellum marinum]|uniref:DNA-3-methyladenine glycosylase n=1 Tax=Pararhodonellum marinum TaxID=2755358 RepID=UPI0018906BAC|nr:DNA-3-methyladenine glycosylase [Pararhodonellum marinum]
MKDIKVISKKFFLEDPVPTLAKNLLGKVIVSHIDDVLTVGRIVETEAYDGEVDRACHAFPSRRTARTEVMFREGGIAYVYLCYGIHHLFNIVTHPENTACAVLIRAIEPIEGVLHMKRRRNVNQLNQLTNGPGKCAQALGITTEYNGIMLHDQTSRIWLGDDGNRSIFKVISSPRIGVDYAGEDALLPWRFYIEHNPFVSKK